MVLDYEDLNDADKAIIGELREGRNIPSNIAEDLDYTREYVSSRLKRLREHEIVVNIGGGVYELVESEVPTDDIAESDSSVVATEPDSTPEVDPVEEAEAPPAEGIPSPTGLEDALTDVDFPATKDREACVEAVRAAYELLKERGTATKKDFVREVMTEHPLGYDVDAALEKLDSEERYRGAWWRRIIKPGLKSLSDVESPPRGGSDWTYTGE